MTAKISIKKVSAGITLTYVDYILCTYTFVVDVAHRT